MPVVRVPVVHKFGIVSLSRAEQLLAQGKEAARTTRSNKSPHPPNEITQPFIVKYNATPEHGRERLDGVVRTALLHAKFKAGLHNQPGGVSLTPTSKFGDPDPGSDLTSAWLELTLLSQCYGRFQEEVLVTLATSLNQARLSTAHIPSLVYIAGLCYQWLKSDITTGEKELRSGELLLLKILYLVSLRLYYHHLIGALQTCCTRDEIRQLKFDLEGFENREPTYRNFPDALLHWKVALEVGVVVCESCCRPLHDPEAPPPDQLAVNDPTGQASSDSQSEKPVPPSRGHSTGHGSHRLNPILWHSLDVWQCVRQEHLSLQEALQDMVTCCTDFSSDNWMDGKLALDILCAASELNTSVLDLVLSLAEGSCRPHSITNPESDHTQVLSEGPSLQPSSALSCNSQSPTETSLEAPQGGISSQDQRKGTRFQLPVSDKGSTAQTEQSDRKSSQRHLATLNILGMQPQFRVPLPEPQVVVESDLEDVGLNFGVRFQDRVRAERNTISPADTVATQSLIENESIPDTASSHESSNTTIELEASYASLEDLSHSKALLTGSSGLQLPESSGLLSMDKVAGSTNRSGRIPGKKVSLEEAGSLVETRMSAAAGTPLEEKLGALESPLDEGTDRIGLFDNRFEYVQREDGEPDKSKLGVSGRGVTLSLPPRYAETRCTHYTHSSGALSGGAGVPGSHVAPSTVYHHSIYSVPSTLVSEDVGSTKSKTIARFENWPSEVAMTYVLNLASITIYGRTSLIQKTALQGRETEGSDSRSYGLMQLANFSNAATVSKCEYSSWTVRHGAVLGLSRVCRVCRELPMKDGLSSMAWSKLVEMDSEERDRRVLEAYKLSQACPDLDGPLLAVDRQPFSCPLIAHIADRLVETFFPSLTPKQPSPRRSEGQSVHQSPNKKHNDMLKNIKPKVVTRVSPKAAPCLPGFTTRTTAALNKIAEEHWRRQIQQETEEEEKVMRQQEAEKRQEYAEKMKRKAEKLANRKPISTVS